LRHAGNKPQATSRFRTSIEGLGRFEVKPLYDKVIDARVRLFEPLFARDNDAVETFEKGEPRSSHWEPLGRPVGQREPRNAAGVQLGRNNAPFSISPSANHRR
jgi:hypothetical protein